MADHGLRDASFGGSRRPMCRLLPRLLHWSASATDAPRATTALINPLRTAKKYALVWALLARMLTLKAEMKVLRAECEPEACRESRGGQLISDLRPLISDPAAHIAFQLQIRFAEFSGEISLFAQDHPVMQDQGEGDDEQQRDPIVQKKPERDLK